MDNTKAFEKPFVSHLFPLPEREAPVLEADLKKTFTGVIFDTVSDLGLKGNLTKAFLPFQHLLSMEPITTRFDSICPKHA